MVKVSVITPVYNGEKYIDKCVGNLLKQRGADFEILLIPNGCTDHSIEKCHFWAEKDKRVKVFESKEKGTSLARKHGVLNADSRYITFMDQDDKYICDLALHEMVEAIEEDKSDICQFGHYMKHFFVPKRRVCSTGTNVILDKEELMSGPYLGAILSRGNFFSVPVWNKIYRSEVLKDAVRSINDSLIYAEDVNLNMYAFSNSKIQKVSSRTESFYLHYCDTGLSSNSDNVIKLLRDYKAVKINTANRMKELGLPEYFFLRLWSEAVYCYRSFINEELWEKKDEKEILSHIEEIESFEYIRMAKEFYADYHGEERNGYIDFLCSGYAPKEYLDYCKRTLPELTLKQKGKRMIKKALKGLGL